jgi:hypothetical protein
MNDRMPPRLQANAFDRIKAELRYFLGSALNWTRLPGMVQPIETYDRLTKTHIKVVTLSLFTVISVGKNDYFFRRLDGKYDGSGTSHSTTAAKPDEAGGGGE